MKDHVATTLITVSFGVAVVPLLWLLWTVASKGTKIVANLGWWEHSQRGITFRSQGGGAYHAMLGTAEQVLACAAISVPLAILIAIYLVEFGGSRLTRLTSLAVDVLSGTPSIVAALFIYAVFITTFGGQRAGIYVSLALVLLMVPVIVRTTEAMLRLVPDELREASYALGVPKWKTVVRVVLPTASSGIITGIMLGVARVAGETAPLLVLVGYAPNINGDLFSGFQGSLPGMMYDQVAQLGNQRYHFAADRMWGAALTLIAIVMGLNLLAQAIARRKKI